MRFNLGRRGEEGLERRELVEFLSARAALLGGILGGDSGSTAPTVPDGGLLNGVLGGEGASKTAATGSTAPSTVSSAPSTSTTTAPGILSSVLGATSAGKGASSSSAPSSLGVAASPLGTSASVQSSASAQTSVAVKTSTPIQSSSPPSSTAVSSSRSAAVASSTTPASSASSSSSIAQSITATQTSGSITQERPTDPTTLLTSVTAAPDNAASSSSVNSSAAAGTNAAESRLGLTNGIQTNSTGHVNVTMIIGIAAGVGGLIFLIALVFTLRRVFRKHRLGRAEYPPSSPLLAPADDSFLPPSLARTISHRSKGSLTNDSKFDPTRNNLQPLNFESEKAGFDRDHRGVISPLPLAAMGPPQVSMLQGQNPQMGRSQGGVSGNLRTFGLP